MGRRQLLNFGRLLIVKISIEPIHLFSFMPEQGYAFKN